MPAGSVCLMHLPLSGAGDACWRSPLVANRAPSGSEVYRVNDSDNRQGGYTEATQNIPGAIAEVRSDKGFRRPYTYYHGDAKGKHVPLHSSVSNVLVALVLVAALFSVPIGLFCASIRHCLHRRHRPLFLINVQELSGPPDGGYERRMSGGDHRGLHAHASTRNRVDQGTGEKELLTT